MDLKKEWKERLHDLNGLDEIKMESMHHTKIIQKQRTKWNDHFIKTKEFSVSDWDLLYDSKYKDYEGKIQSRWLGPYEIHQVFPNGVSKWSSQIMNHRCIQILTIVQWP